MRPILSQDNFPSHCQRSRGFSRALISGISAATLACLGLLATTTRLQWQVPSLDQDAPVITASVSTKIIQNTYLRPVKTAIPNPRPRFAPVKYTPDKITIKTVPANTNTPSEKRISAQSRLPAPFPRRVIKQPGNNIVINRLPYSHKIPVSSDGMPEFYKMVLEPKGKMTDLGLMQRKVRPNFGYDQQDIFTGEVPDGAYVLHCQRLRTLIVRAMCWRELQVSDDQWVQYRFPRTQLKDWWKIEQKVRASIG